MLNTTECLPLLLSEHVSISSIIPWLSGMQGSKQASNTKWLKIKAKMNLKKNLIGKLRKVSGRHHIPISHESGAGGLQVWYQTGQLSKTLFKIKLLLKGLGLGLTQYIKA